MKYLFRYSTHFHSVFVFSAADMTKELISTKQNQFMWLDDSELGSHIQLISELSMNSNLILYWLIMKPNYQSLL